MTSVEFEREPQPIQDPYERLELFHDAQGFYPESLTELSRAFLLLSYIDRPGGAARHLNDIFHYAKATKEKAEKDMDPELFEDLTKVRDPAQSVRAVTKRFSDWYKLSKSSLTSLETLGHDIDQADYPGLTLDKVAGSDLGFAELVHFVDLSKLARTRQVNDGEVDPLRSSYSFSPTSEVGAHIKAVASELRVKELRVVLPASIEDQRTRARFWQDRLTESKRHSLAWSIANTALRFSEPAESI